MKKWTLLIIIQKKWSATEKNKHVPSVCTIFIWYKKNKLDYYRGKDDMKKFRKDLKECAAEITNYEKKEMIPQTDETDKRIRK